MKSNDAELGITGANDSAERIHQQILVERKRLHGISVEFSQELWGFLEGFVAVCNNNASVVLETVQSVLRIVNNYMDQAWPDDSAWEHILPSNFVNAFPPPKTPEEEKEHEKWLKSLPPKEEAEASYAEKWTLLEVLYWLQPSERTWYWWDAVIVSPDKLEIRVATADKEFLYLWGALRWLFKGAGAVEVLEKYDYDEQYKAVPKKD